MIELSLNSPAVNVANIVLQGALVYLQHHPDCDSLLNVVIPFVLARTELDETYVL